MYERIQDKEVKTNKAHFCEWCAGYLSKGSYARYRAYRFNGEFQYGWMHDDCARAMDECIDDYPEGWVPGDFERGSTVSVA